MEHYSADIVIVGSGFAGSIMAMCLRRQGHRVIIIEKGKHPRFAIGESSTPIADMVLRDLSRKYRLPVLGKLSRYGTWQTCYPEVACGLKRGFSYYQHRKGEPYWGGRHHKSELLVAASVNDVNSDTNWYRQHTDHFLANEAQKTGAVLLEEAEIVKAERDASKKAWELLVQKKSETIKVQCTWMLDCTGSSFFAEKFFGAQCSSGHFKTNTFAVYSHFNNAGFWRDYLSRTNCYIKDYPYNPDHSALHHLMDEGWLWMLRFNNNRLSAGMVFDAHKHRGALSGETLWKKVIGQYPSLQTLFSAAVIARPPGKIIRTGRLQRKLNKVHGDGWFALPHTAAFVDPMHSTGMAHTLIGMEFLLRFFDKSEKKTDPGFFGKAYQNKLFREIDWMDFLISLSYKTAGNFSLFTIAVMLYFVATVHYENNRLAGNHAGMYLGADNEPLKQVILDSAEKLEWCLANETSKADIARIEHLIRQKISKFNTAGLLAPGKNNMYFHTAAVLDSEV